MLFFQSSQGKLLSSPLLSSPPVGKSALSWFSSDSPTVMSPDYFQNKPESLENQASTDTHLFIFPRPLEDGCVTPKSSSLPSFPLYASKALYPAYQHTRSACLISARCVDGVIFTLFRDHARSELHCIPVFNIQTYHNEG